MADLQYNEASERLKKIVQANNSEESDDAYSDWSKYYDEDLSVLGNVDYIAVAENTMEFMVNKESSMLLDAAAGTGRIAEVLKSCAYEGTMDALELNANMLSKAKEKELYRKHIQFRMTPDESLPVDDNSYDAVICSGSMLPRHVEPGCVLPMLRALKIGGLLSFSCRQSEFCKKYNEELKTIVDFLISEGKLETVIVKEIIHYKTTKKEISPSQAMLYNYRKKANVE